LKRAQSLESTVSLKPTKVVPEKCYGFIRFARVEEARFAIGALNNFDIGGITLSVSLAAEGSDQHEGQPQIQVPSTIEAQVADDDPTSPAKPPLAWRCIQ